MILKFAALIAVIAGCTYVGRLFSMRIILREEALTSLMNSIKRIESYLKFENMTLHSAFLRCAAGQDKYFSQFFKRCAEYIKRYPNQPFFILWKKCFNEEQNNAIECLSGKDKEMMLQLGKGLVHSTMDAQCVNFQTFYQEIKAALHEVKSLKDKKIKVYHALGILTGIGLAIIII